MQAVIIGAGALGLGFLAERLAPHYRLVLVDVETSASRLESIERLQGYWVNICGRDGIVPRWVDGSFGALPVDTSGGRARLHETLQEADLILTAVGRSHLDGVVADIAPALRSRRRKAWLLFCENGRHIAERHAGQVGSQAVPVNTVMSRMCRFAGPEETGAYHPIAPEDAAALVAEEYSYLPLDETPCAGGPFSEAFTLVGSEEFRLWEDVKLFLHNGMHAFVAYHAFLHDIRTFPEVPPWLRDWAREVALTEIVPALIKTHVCARPEELELYAGDLLDRFYSPSFNDSVERGIRDVEEKLAPGERILGGCELIRRAGIEPRGYATLLEAAQKIRARRRAG